MTHTDRYQVHLDCRPLVGRLARTYEAGPFLHVSPAIIAQYRAQVELAYSRIPVSVQFVHGEEPYASVPEMQAAIRATGIMKVRWIEHAANHPLGHSHDRFRALHDWYGHVLPSHQFNMDGELSAYHEHVRQKLFTRHTLPLVWSEVVLENAYRLFRGHWYRWYKPVYDPLWGRVPELALTQQKENPNAEVAINILNPDLVPDWLVNRSSGADAAVGLPAPAMHTTRP